MISHLGIDVVAAAKAVVVVVEVEVVIVAAFDKSARVVVRSR